MNDEEIKQAREKYVILKQEREKLIQQKERMSKLREDDKVAEYIALCNELNLLSDITLPTDEELAYSAFYDIAQKTTQKCNVYLYLGLEENKSHSYLGCPYRLTSDERRIYKNLDTGYRFHNYAEKKDIFESNNTIINCFDTDPEQKFKNFQKQYFLNLTKYGTEEAIQKTLSRFK